MKHTLLFIADDLDSALWDAWCEAQVDACLAWFAVWS